MQEDEADTIQFSRTEVAKLGGHAVQFVCSPAVYGGLQRMHVKLVSLLLYVSLMQGSHPVPVCASVTIAQTSVPLDEGKVKTAICTYII